MDIHGTTVISVRRDGLVVIGADGQVTQGSHTILKHKANKIRKLYEGRVLTGFAGATADAFTLLDEFEGMLSSFQGNIRRSAIELAKKWRTDKMLRRLDALLMAVDAGTSLLISGAGDVIEPEDGILAIGSGGMYAYAAAKALLQNSSLDARKIVAESLLIAASICVYSNDQIVMEEIEFA